MAFLLSTKKSMGGNQLQWGGGCLMKVTGKAGSTVLRVIHSSTKFYILDINHKQKKL